MIFILLICFVWFWEGASDSNCHGEWWWVSQLEYDLDILHVNGSKRLPQFRNSPQCFFWCRVILLEEHLLDWLHLLSWVFMFWYFYILNVWLKTWKNWSEGLKKVECQTIVLLVHGGYTDIAWWLGNALRDLTTSQCWDGEQEISGMIGAYMDNQMSHIVGEDDDVQRLRRRPVQGK